MTNYPAIYGYVLKVVSALQFSDYNFVCTSDLSQARYMSKVMKLRTKIIVYGVCQECVNLWN
jgi:hypothetical protein